MIISNDQITYIGSESDAAVVAAQSHADTTTIDLNQQTLLPSFIDGHMHLLMFGQSLEKVNLEHCRSLEDIRSTIRAAAAADHGKSRIMCKSWMHFMTDHQALASDLDDLDELQRPIFIDSKDLHSTWVNSAALRELNVQDAPDPEGGMIHRDNDGNPSGLLSEAAAVTIVWPHLARAATMDEKKAWIRNAITTYNSAGYTGVVEMAMDENAWEALVEFTKSEELLIRIVAHWLIYPSKSTEENLKQVDRAIDLARQYNLNTSPSLRITGIKVIGDGVVDACTASLLQPYSHNGVSVDPLWSKEHLTEVVKRADAAGLQCALHAIGDATVKLAIDVLEASATKGNRHRIEHLEVTSPGDAKRLEQNGITASVQAVHADPAITREWDKLLSKDRRQRAFAYREFLDEGALIALGTDAPTAPNLPLQNLYVATTRKSAREPDCQDTFNEQYALPLLDAISAATRGAAYSCFSDKLAGTLEVGKKADFVVLDFDWEPQHLLKAKLVQTWFAGKKVFDGNQ
ncbi:hypothetical protein B0A52_07864 [Exophiala mesophila]|uniref:Amidohydrolase 3 domain-containing protein n=1 Tax=Exophiala mesophila TaxID=212818 RepID=A0A438MVG2_EXOME|nr:hypothetical protein B0A52_07864 [Exophiala mesophila]